MLTENYIWSLLTGDYDWDRIIRRLEWLGRAKAPGLEGHHVEPERVMEVYLKPLEHLAIHVAHARLDPTASNRAKVRAFIQAWPGSWRRILPVSDELRTALISYGQARPGSGIALAAHPNTDRARHAPHPWAAENGRRGAEKTRGKPRLTPCTWGDKISAAAKAQPVFTCEHCGKKVKGKPNLVQHQHGPKCVPPENYVMSCLLCGKGFLSNNLGTLTRHIMGTKCLKSPPTSSIKPLPAT